MTLTSVAIMHALTFAVRYPRGQNLSDFDRYKKSMAWSSKQLPPLMMHSPTVEGMMPARKSVRCCCRTPCTIVANQAPSTQAHHTHTRHASESTEHGARRRQPHNAPSQHGCRTWCLHLAHPTRRSVHSPTAAGPRTLSFHPTTNCPARRGGWQSYPSSPRCSSCTRYSRHRTTT
jgi:hypothetical protein